MKDYIYLIAPVCGWIVAQSIKFVLFLRKDGVRLSDAVQSGGMPSSHAAFMAAITTTIGLDQGFESAIFGLALAVTAIVSYDAMGVRRTTGEHTDAINTLVAAQKVKKPIIHVSRGHSFVQIVGGLIVGILTGVLVYNLLG